MLNQEEHLAFDDSKLDLILSEVGINYQKSWAKLKKFIKLLCFINA